ncbi:SDR family NAD(P)-dependent oxidoreductase [Sphingomonas canadensis]|uniref:SDR family NAD(P)-dependent oxidoreductase n=1 Tax=Sphingomonas canadensis TaxID=1219257 RepID=A0ABW3H7Z8_9SPHN|nr:SDR family oxidoreductase [Sphingomonas canadensis]MCW3834528.1 SDR family oxidoreductase [Sphingomonas canadensis]
MKLANQVALIFGGSSGIGKATALRLAREGATVAVVASEKLARATAVADEIAAAGGKARGFVADVRDVQSIRSVVADVEAALGPIEIMVYSAGVYYPTILGELDEAKFDAMVDINFKGAFFAIDAVAGAMKTHGRGRIVTLASVAAFRGSSSYPLYAATKAAVMMLTKSLVGRLAPHGIHINAVAPGNTATPLNENDRLGAGSAEILAAKAAITPSGRTYSPPEEIAAAIHFLVSGEVRAMHGATLLIDEGLFAGM